MTRAVLLSTLLTVVLASAAVLVPYVLGLHVGRRQGYNRGRRAVRRSALPVHDGGHVRAYTPQDIAQAMDVPAEWVADAPAPQVLNRSVSPDEPGIYVDWTVCPCSRCASRHGSRLLGGAR